MRGYQQFEAIGFERGADGKSHTADDVAVGPVEVDWPIEVFYAPAGSNSEGIGQVSAGGLFSPASKNPGSNSDVWVVAKARNEKDQRNNHLVGKAYLVVMVPAYAFNGRKYVRDLDRWVYDGPAGADTKEKKE